LAPGGEGDTERRAFVHTSCTAQSLRDACALACLARIGDILKAYDLAWTVLDNRKVDDRAVDLWAPLLALAMVADIEAGGDRADLLLEAAEDLSEAREADDEAGQAARLVGALQRVAGEVGTVLTPTELLEAIRERGYSGLKSTRGLASLMGPLGFVARHAREGARRGRFYVLDSAVLADLATRYNPAALDGVGAASAGSRVASVDKP
jgi:hypothetical protein